MRRMMRWMLAGCTFAMVSWVFVPDAWASGGADKDRCRETREAQADIAVQVLNMMNIGTTRTVEGGAFKPWSCVGEVCAQSGDAPIMKYEPDHPDADENGMVAYPNLDLMDLMARITRRYAELSILAKLRACGAGYLDVGDIKGVTYADSRTRLKWISFVLKNGELRYVFTKPVGTD